MNTNSNNTNAPSASADQPDEVLTVPLDDHINLTATKSTLRVLGFAHLAKRERRSRTPRQWRNKL